MPFSVRKLVAIIPWNFYRLYKLTLAPNLFIILVNAWTQITFVGRLVNLQFVHARNNYVLQVYISIIHAYGYVISFAGSKKLQSPRICLWLQQQIGSVHLSVSLSITAIQLMRQPKGDIYKHSSVLRRHGSYCIRGLWCETKANCKWAFSYLD